MNCPHCGADVTEDARKGLKKARGDFVMMCPNCGRLIVVEVTALKLPVTK